VSEKIFELAECYGDWDDFGRWTFRDNDQLLAFVDAIQKNEREKCARTIDDLVLEHPGRADLTAQQCAQAIRARGETTKGCQCQLCLAHTARIHAIDMSQKRVDETAKHGHEPVAWREVIGKTTHYYDYNEQGRGEPLYSAPVAQCTYPRCQATNGCVGACSKGQPDLARVGEVGIWGDKREWVGFTHEELAWLNEALNLGGRFAVIEAIEAKLKEKNHD